MVWFGAERAVELGGKLRRLRQLYPEVRIKLFYERDFERIAARYGLRKAS